jgi:hypothetical protein
VCLCRRREEGIAGYGYKPWFSPESHTYCPILLIINKIGKWITNCLVGGGGGGGRERGGGGVRSSNEQYEVIQ